MEGPRTRERARRLDHSPEAVRYARKKAGLSQTELAHEIGISPQLMSEIESGWRNATPANLIKIAKALNCPLVVLEAKREDYERAEHDEHHEHGEQDESESEPERGAA